ncbi:MAG TPA: hypothetical protein VE282_02985 [Gemmatimonadales bacterium]|jgi:hypothetical protein|nr:hypothetical protein [Gemmatimonadales bacterium]
MTEAENWLTRRLALEGPGLWTVSEYQELGKKLARDYWPAGPKWRVKEWTQRPEEISVYVVTRGGDFGIHRVDDCDRAFEKADAVMHALNALDAVVSKSGQAVCGNGDPGEPQKATTPFTRYLRLVE